MKTLFQLALSVMLIVSIALLNACTNKTEKTDQKEETTEVSYYNATSTDLCENDWFPHTQTPPPAEGKGSPFDTSSTTNAIFHQWSWQKFLWLTKPTETTNAPLFLSGELAQVTAHLEDIAPKPGATVVLTDTAQAGSSGVLKTNPVYNSESRSAKVFYSIHVNDILKSAATAFKDSIVSGTLAKDNLSAFPIGALELKVSWVEKSVIPSDKVSSYFTTVAAVSSDGKNYTNMEVAMLGMHVVGIVINHPEFIWATFEHDDLAPNYNWTANNATSSNENLLFASGTTTGIDGITWVKTADSVKLAYKVFDLFQFGVPRDMKGEFMKTSQEEPINFDNIQNINTCVKENLEDVWKSYFYNGSIWVDTDGLSPKGQAELLVKLKHKVADATPGSYARGSLNCANVSMETYTQTFQSSIDRINVGNLANCFSCHNAVSFTKNTSPIYMSHIFDAYIKRAEGMTFSEMEAVKARQELEEFMQNQSK